MKGRLQAAGRPVRKPLLSSGNGDKQLQHGEGGCKSLFIGVK